MKLYNINEAIAEANGKIIINLWCNQYKKPDVIGGNKECKHIFDKDGICYKCNAYQDNIGCEPWNKYINHIIWLSNQLKEKYFAVVSPRWVPTYINDNGFMKIRHGRRDIYFINENKFVMIFNNEVRYHTNRLEIDKGKIIDWAIKEGFESFINWNSIIPNKEVFICNSMILKQAEQTKILTHWMKSYVTVKTKNAT